MILVGMTAKLSPTVPISRINRGQCRKARRWSLGTYVSDDVALLAMPVWELTPGSELQVVEKGYFEEYCERWQSPQRRDRLVMSV